MEKVDTKEPEQAMETEKVKESSKDEPKKVSPVEAKKDATPGGQDKVNMDTDDIWGASEEPEQDTRKTSWSKPDGLKPSPVTDNGIVDAETDKENVNQGSKINQV